MASVEMLGLFLRYQIGVFHRHHFYSTTLAEKLNQTSATTMEQQTP